MKLNKINWLWNGYVIFSTLFFVFGLIFFVDMNSSIRVMKLGIDSIAPENLKGAPESFRLSLRVESRDFPVEEMMKTKSWDKLQSTVSGYAKRLELIENQNRQRSIIVSWTYLVAGIGMAAFTTINRWQSKQEKIWVKSDE